MVVRDGKVTVADRRSSADVIRLGLRLTLGGGKEAAVRLAITAMAVAIGVGLLLITLAGMNAINAQNARSAWLDTGFSNGPGPPGDPVGGAGPRPSRFGGSSPATISTTRTIYRVDLAATGPTLTRAPRHSRLPGPGQYYASPALIQLLRTRRRTSSPTASRAAHRHHWPVRPPVAPLADRRHRPHPGPAQRRRAHSAGRHPSTPTPARAGPRVSTTVASR